MCHPGAVDDVTWGALTLTLTLLGGIGTWIAYRRRGLGAGLQGAGLSLLPLAALLTGSLEMLGRVVDAVGDWATALVLSPAVWVGIVVAGTAVLLVGSGRALSARSSGPRPVRSRAGSSRPVGPAPAADDDLAEIEALLRRRGIS